MELLLTALAVWFALSILGVLGAAAVCRAGHVEDVARGFVDLDSELDGGLAAPAQVLVPRSRQAKEVTHR